MNRAALKQHLINLYIDSLGVAAEFVVEDAFIVLDHHPEWLEHPQLMRAQFLVHLERLTPPEVPFGALRQQIVDKIKETDLSR
jgi:hypothetical protein